MATPPRSSEAALGEQGTSDRELKLVSAMFVDVVGFSTISESLDPEELLELMDGCFEILATEVGRFGGTVNKFTGDGMMALFGAPTAAEEHAARSVRCALSIQRELESHSRYVADRWGIDFRMRIGLNTGEVVVGSIGSAETLEYTALGDAINVAARLESLAEPGGVLASAATVHLAGPSFLWDPQGDVTVKGRSEPVEIHRLQGIGPPRSRFDGRVERGLTPLAGRSAELAQLLDLWESSQRGEGAVVSIVGDAGMGKSRLIHEFKERIAERGAGYLEGSCFALGDQIAYLPFVEILRAWTGIGSATDAGYARTACNDLVRSAGLDEHDATPYLLSLLSLPTDAAVAQLPAAELMRRTRRTVRGLIGGSAGHEPLTLIIEDVHWIDASTEELLGELIAELSDMPVLLVLVFRPEYLGDLTTSEALRIEVDPLFDDTTAGLLQSVLGRPHAWQLQLDRLSPSEASGLVRSVLAVDAVPSDLAEFVTNLAEGNPLFIEELTLDLIEHGSIQIDEGVVTVPHELTSSQTPTTLRGVLLSRVDRLSDHEKRLLQFAAVIGRVFELDLLRAVTPSTEPDPAPLLAGLCQRDFVYQLDADGHDYSFKHVLAQQVIYEQLLKSNRRTMHRAVGEALRDLRPGRLEDNCEALAHHFSQADDAVLAFEFHSLASRKHLRMSAMLTADGHASAAFRHLDQLDQSTERTRQRLDLLLDQVFVVLALFKYREYLDRLEVIQPAVEAIGDSVDLAALHARKGWCQWAIGDFREGVQSLDLALEHSQASGRHEELGFTLMTRQWCELALGQTEQSLATGRAAIAATTQHFDLQSAVRAHCGVCLSNTYLGRWDAAVSAAAEAMAIAEAHGANGVLSFAMMIGAWPFAAQGDLDASMALAKTSLEMASEAADQMLAVGTSAWISGLDGADPASIEVLEQVSQAIRDMGFRALEMFTIYLVEVSIRCGDIDRAQATLDQLIPVLDQHEMRFYRAQATRLLGEIALHRSEFGAALDLFDSCSGEFSAAGAAHESALLDHLRGLALVASGRQSEGGAALAAAQEAFAAAGTLWPPNGSPRHAT